MEGFPTFPLVAVTVITGPAELSCDVMTLLALQGAAGAKGDRGDIGPAGLMVRHFYLFFNFFYKNTGVPVRYRDEVVG